MTERLRRILTEAYDNGARLIRDDGEGRLIHPIHLLAVISDHDRLLDRINDAIDALEDGAERNTVIEILWPIGDDE